MTNQIYIDHITNQFKQGTPVLFTGAGFSLDAFNCMSGDVHVPTVGSLSKSIWKLCFPDDKYDDETTLQDLYETALNTNPKGLQRLLEPMLRVNSQSLPDWYQTIFLMPWSRYYTLNIDNIEDAIPEKFQIPFALKITSGTTNESHVTREKAQYYLDVIHLNGTIDDLPYKVTFSMTQFAQRIARRDPNYMRLAAELLSRPFVFIGTTLNESPLWQHIELRKQEQLRGSRELRPRSYLVTPTLSPAKRALLAEYNIVWLEMSGEEFAKKILSNIRSQVSSGFEILHNRDNPAAISSFTAVSDLIQGDDKKTDYLIGQEPIWVDIKFNRVIARDSDEGILKKAKDVLKIQGDIKGLIAITGTAGAGKSSSLMQLAYKLSVSGYKIGWIDRDMNVVIRDVIGGMLSDEAPDALFIDDVDIFGSDVSSWLSTIMFNDNYPLVVVALRSSKIDGTLNKSFFRDKKVAYIEKTMPLLSEPDIGKLIDVLTREQRLGALKNKERQEQEFMFRKYSGRQLLVAMYSATSGDDFEDKIKSELLELENNQQFIYALISTASFYRHPLKREDIIIAAGDRVENSLNSLGTLLSRHLVVELPGDQKWIKSRHRLIAEIVSRELQTHGLLKDVIHGLLLVAATKGTSEKVGNYKRMLITFLNNKLLSRLLGYEQAKAIYGSLENLFSNDYHFWLHRGSLELHEGTANLF